MTAAHDCIDADFLMMLIMFFDYEDYDIVDMRIQMGGGNWLFLL